MSMLGALILKKAALKISTYALTDYLRKSNSALKETDFTSVIYDWFDVEAKPEIVDLVKEGASNAIDLIADLVDVYNTVT